LKTRLIQQKPKPVVFSAYVHISMTFLAGNQQGNPTSEHTATAAAIEDVSWKPFGD